MKPLVAILVAAMLCSAGHSAAQQKVDARGIASSVKIEEAISGHLPELNGKFKFRVTEVTFEPGAHLGAHHHAGPGIRYVASGRLSFIQAGKETIYQTGDYFYESGNVVHTAQNKTKSPVRIIFFEVLPAQWASPSVIPPKTF
jgi:quercetin dioxygenase-like cupin family protein